MLEPMEFDLAPAVASSRPFRSVLILEDDGLLSMMLEDLVRSEGAKTIHSCRTPATALTLVQSICLDCAILDVAMHGETSYAVADDLAARGIPFLFCTGLRRADIIERHRARPLLAKPYGEREFRAVLAVTLAG